MCIFYPKADNSFIIQKGTPLVQVVPFVRYPWKHKIEYLSREEILKMSEDVVVKAFDDRGEEGDEGEYKHYYRKNLASRKEFK